uniref:Uncharacterized protein n=1 Tax=Romanomermis culicivorax TaxID=13658 RepID=A0A915HM30_ROMCU
MHPFDEIKWGKHFMVNETTALKFTLKLASKAAISKSLIGVGFIVPALLTCQSRDSLIRKMDDNKQRPIANRCSSGTVGCIECSSSSVTQSSPSTITILPVAREAKSMIPLETSATVPYLAIGRRGGILLSWKNRDTIERAFNLSNLVKNESDEMRNKLGGPYLLCGNSKALLDMQ